MSYDSDMRRTAAAAVVQMSFEDRDEFIRHHDYKPRYSKPVFVETEGLNREQIVHRHYPDYTLDALYEYCVIRNLITLLNLYGKLKKKRAFTLGHYKPLSKGGSHHVSNWIIQTSADNQKQADNEFESVVKWSRTEQVNYIMSKIDYYLGVDESYQWELQKYISKFNKVYQNDRQEQQAS